MSVQPINAAIARRPALPVAVMFIVGISLHLLLPHWPLAWLIAIALLLASTIVFRRHGAACSASLALSIILCGVCAAQLAEFDYPRQHISNFAGDEPRLAWVEGQIDETPRLIEATPGGRPMPDKQIVWLKTSSLRTWSGWIPAAGTIPVTISPPVAQLAAGQQVRLLGRLERPQPAMNPGAFDSAQHYRRQRVLASMHVSRPYDVQILSSSSALVLPLVKLRDSSRDLLDRGFDAAHAADRALLRAMVFADHEPALRDAQEDFTRTGTNHLLAANGSRIAILALAIYLLCRLLRLPPRPALAALTGTITLFGFTTMPAAEALRPAVVCAAVGFATIGRRRVDSIQMLALVAIALLVPRPLELYGAGFQLSFVIVLGMMVFISPVRRWVLTFRNRDKLVAESFAPQTRRLRAWRWLRGWLLTAVVAGSVAWAIALPLVAYHFEQLTPWTVPFGILLAPFALLALTAGFFKIFFTTLCPSLAASWAGIATVPAAALRHLVHSLAHVPFSDLPMSRPPVWWIFLYYALLVLPLIPWPRRKVRWCARCGPAAAGMLAAFPLCVGFAALGSNSTELRVTLLSVGAGQCAVLEPSGGGVVIIDAGSSTVSDPVRTCFEPFLRHQQRRSVDSIFLSHGDYDHISAAQQIVSEYSVQQVLTSPHFRRHAHESKPCESLLATLDQTGHSPRLIIMGDDLQVGSDIAVQVLWPPANCPLNSNNTGLVLRVTCAGRSILFPADIQEPAERELLKHPEKLRSDILVAPHHGSAETTTAQFIAAVNPSTIVASSDSRLTKKQRTFDAAEKRWPIYRTGRCGAITIEIQKDGAIRVEPYLRSQIP